MKLLVRVDSLFFDMSHFIDFLFVDARTLYERLIIPSRPTLPVLGVLHE